MANRKQRRAAMKKGKRPGETYADVLANRRIIREAVEKTARDESVALESDIKTQRFLWMSVVALMKMGGSMLLKSSAVSAKRSPAWRSGRSMKRI